MELIGRTALITGAARRVGRAVALELASAGCDIAIHHRTSRDAAESLAEEIRTLGRRAVLVRGDLADPSMPARIVAETVEQLGRLDVLVNNASIFEKTPIDHADPTHWERVFRVNVIAPAMLSRAAAPHMKACGAGRIVNFTDILADRPSRGYDAYCASKAALASLTRSLARDLAPEITVNAIAPGVAVFPDSYDDKTRERIIARVPLAREGTPEEIAAAIRFLVADADYITGQVIPVDGGRSIRP